MREVGLAQETVPQNPTLSATGIVLRPLGSAIRLGIFTFCVGALITACCNLHWIAKAQFKPTAIVLLAFVVPLEAISSLLAFLSRDVAGATTMGIFAASWAVFSTFWLTFGSVQSPVLGIFSVILTAIISCLSVVARRARPLLAIILTIAMVRDSFRATFHFGVNAALPEVGWCGLILTPLSIYCALAFPVEDANQHALLPVFRRRRAKQSLEGSLSDQIQRMEKKPA